MHQSMQDAIATCMRGDNQDYTPAPYQGIAGGPVAPADVTFAAPLGTDFGIASGKQSVAEGLSLASNRGIEDLGTAERQQEYFQALETCAGAGEQFQESYRPASQDSLAAPFEALLLSAQDSAAVQAEMLDYRDCLAGKGIRASHYLELWMLAQARFPAVDVPWEQLQDRPDWAAAGEYEPELAAADASCRANLRVVGMSVSWRGLQQFAADHTVDLAAIDAAWAEIRAVAAAELTD